MSVGLGYVMKFITLMCLAVCQAAPLIGLSNYQPPKVPDDTQ